jgi:hypothetical protein
MTTPPRSETLSNLRNELEAFGETLERTRERARELEQRPGVKAQEDMHRALVEIARSIESARRSVERALKIVKNT